MTTHMNKVSDYLQQQNINNILSVHSLWHAARNNTTGLHKVDRTKIFIKSHLTSFSFVVRRTEVPVDGQETSPKTV